MLNIVQGRSGTGKTKYVCDILSEFAAKGQSKLLYLIPEQSSFESEKYFLQTLGPKLCGNVNVMSFTRLYDMVMRSTGGFSGTAIDDGIKRVMMSLALEDCRDELELYGKQAMKPQFTELMLTAVREFKTCDVSAALLREHADKNRGTELGQKLKELSLITDLYNSYIYQSYIDPLDNNERLEKTLSKIRFFAGYTIVMDGFSGFTMQEINIIKLLMEQADEFYVTLDMGNDDNDEKLFYDITQMKKTLMQIAADSGIGVRYEKKLKENYRIKASGIVAIEKEIYSSFSECEDNDPEGVTIAVSDDIFEECSYVAESIYKLAVSGKCRYRDIAVVCRNSENYRGILDSALESRGVPYFMSKPFPIDTKPLILLVLSAFEYVITMNCEKLFSIAKCGLVEISDYDAALLENYAYIWNLKGKSFKSDFTLSPYGFGETDDEKAQKDLGRLNEIRAKLMTPLMDFEKKIKQGGVLEISKAVYELLIDYKVDKSIRHMSDEFAEEENRLWDFLMDLLNKMYLCLADREITYKRYYELLSSVLKSAQISEIPQTLDQITIGTADSIRFNNPYAVFVIGAIDGEFPHIPVQSGVFSDNERRLLISERLPLYNALEELFLHEKYLVYNAVSAPTDKLFVTYYKKDLKGNEVKPSSIVSQIKRILPGLETYNVSFADEEFIYSKKSAFERCTLGYTSDDPFSIALREYFRDDKEYTDKLKSVERAVRRKDFEIKNKVLAQRLFGKDKRISASQIENFNKCKFLYYCKYGLRLKERTRAELNPMEYGNIVHYLLEKTLAYYKEHDYEPLSIRQLSELLDELMENYMDEVLGGSSDKTERFRIMYQRIKESTEMLVMRMNEELALTDFRPCDFELDVGSEDGIEGYSVKDHDGNTVTVRGVIDRVDLMKKNGKDYIRIVDYKTGSKKFKISDILHGLNMQMLLYLAAIAKNGKSRYGENIVPSGVLYMPAFYPTVSVDPGDDDEAVKKAHDGKLKMNGIILDDPDVYLGMDQAVTERFVPIKVNKNGSLSADTKKNLITAEQLCMIFDKIDDQIARMSDGLNEGEIEAYPVSGSYTPCDNCPYKSVCARDKTAKDRPIKSDKDIKNVIEALKNEREGEN